MYIDQFVEKYNDKFINKDGAYQNQCWDGAAQYFSELGVGETFLCSWTGGVRDLIEHYNEIWGLDKSKIRLTLNDPSQVDQIPKKGDVVVTKTGYYGHIFMVIEADQNGMKTFEQNGVKGTGTDWEDRCRILKRDYKDVLGWITILSEEGNNSQPTPPPTPLRDVRTEMQNAAKYFYPERVIVIATAYDNSDKDYLMNEIIWAGQSSDRQNQEIEKIKQENMNLTQKIQAVEKLSEVKANKPVIDTSSVITPQDVKEEPKTTIIEPVSKSKTIFESKKAIMSLVATFITFVVSVANQYWKMDLKVEEIIGIVSPLIIGIVSQASTEIGK